MNLLFIDKQCIQHYFDLVIELMNLVREIKRILLSIPIDTRHPEREREREKYSAMIDSLDLQISFFSRVFFV